MTDPHPHEHEKKKVLPRDEFGRGESWHWIVFAVPAAIAALAFLLQSTLPGKSARGDVTLYCAQDMVYADPIVQAFEKRNQCDVRAVYDSEAVKTVGLANRLLAEKSNPRCDVFWGNEEMRTRQLVRQGVFRKDEWAAFGFRSRRIVINTNLLPLAQAPKSLMELTNATWRGKVAMAYPQFGTTATHFHVLRQHWGDAAWEQWCRALAANKPLLLDGNSTVVKMVGSGRAPIGLTDSDDIAVGLAKGWPLAAQPMNEETLLVPNTVALVNKPQRTELARAFYEYLQSPEIVQILVAGNALEGADVRQVKEPVLQVNWDAVLDRADETTQRLSEIFLR